ncbi:hypothetical protein AJ88_48935 [Mesorhizobium amorphae CCBAU 01583]|nr:hypothetical protein AJ88_48935 [Mesorhizobium amorphae CCBAU 01583]
MLSNVYEGDPAWNDFDQTQGRIGYEFEHRFNDVLTVRQNLRYNAVDSDIEYSGHYSIGADQPLQRYWGHYTETMKNFVVDNMAQFEFDTGPVRHTAVGGIDYAWSDYDAGSGISYVSVDDIKSASVPHYGGQEMNQLGVYLHDQMEWNDFILFTSGRYDWVDTTSTAADFSSSKQKDSAFSGRLGLSYQTEWGITPYVNYSTSFSPNIGFVFDDVTSTVGRGPARPSRRRRRSVSNTRSRITTRPSAPRCSTSTRRTASSSTPRPASTSSASSTSIRAASNWKPMPLWTTASASSPPTPICGSRSSAAPNSPPARNCRRRLTISCRFGATTSSRTAAGGVGAGNGRAGRRL